GDREVRAPAATTDSPAAAVEQAEIDVVPAAHTPERILRAVQRPVGHPVATVLVAVRVAEHQLLEPAPRLELHGVYAIPEQRAHVVAGVREVLDRLEEGHEVEVALESVPSQSHQAALPCEQHGLEQVADLVCHADDEAAHRVGVEL